MTLGKHGVYFPYSGAIEAASSFGSNIQELDVRDVCVDWKNLLVTTPCYMQENASHYEVFEGIDKLVRKVTSLVRQTQSRI